MANRTEDRKFGSYALDSTNGIILSSWQTRQLRETDFAPRLRGAGSLVLEDRLTGSQALLSGKVIGADTEAVRDNMDGLVEALSQGEQYLQFYDDRRLLCRLDSDVRMELEALGRAYAFQARFTSRWPSWEDPSPVNEQFTPSGAGPHILTTSTVAGTAPTWPVITIQTHIALTAVNLLITNTGTLEQIHLVGLNLNDEQAIILDMFEGFLGDGVASSVTPQAVEGDWFSLSPGAAAVIEISHNAGASADWTIDVDYVPRYWAA